MTGERDVVGGRLALISLLTAVEGLLMIGVGAVLARLGIVPPLIGFAVAVFGVFPAIAAVVFGVRVRRREGGGRLRAGLTLGMLQIAAMVGMGINALRAPRINDITTDLVDPPPLTVEGGPPVPYPAEFAAIQREAYPAVQPLMVSLPADEVRDVVGGVMAGAGWTMQAVEDGGNLIRATAVTRVFRFVDDIVVRITPEDGGARIDLRSRSRVGRGDLGTNAARIEAFLEDVRRRVGG